MSIVVVGDPADGHVISVVTALERRGMNAVLLDSPTLSRSGFSVTLDSVTVDGDSFDLIDPDGTGWLRRYAPSGWGTGAVAGSLEAVTKRAFLALVGSISRLGDRHWLTSIEAMLRGEDRLVQLELARSLGFRTPFSIVTSDPREAVSMIGPSIVVKPISGGYYWTTDGPRAVFASVIHSDEVADLDFTSAPFVAQERLHARSHFRVVTVGSRVWACELKAEGLPLDWRQDDEAHFSWRATENAELCQMAEELAAAIEVGYSSQDWILDKEGYAFLDLNPGGQWLFLPDPIGQSISNAIASFLVGDER